MKDKKSETNQDILVSTVIDKEKKNDSKKIIWILLGIIFVLIFALIFVIIDKENSNDKLKCSSVTIKEVEVDPKYQLINYNGFRFKMPLDWNFVSVDNKYEIVDNDEKLIIELASIDVGYELFSSSEYQKDFLEYIQTIDNIKIDSAKEVVREDKKYYYYEGTNNSYDYLIVAIGNKDKIILVNVKFRDKLALNDLDDTVVDFSLSAL